LECLELIDLMLKLYVKTKQIKYEVYCISTEDRYVISNTIIENKCNLFYVYVCIYGVLDEIYNTNRKCYVFYKKYMQITLKIQNFHNNCYT